MENPEGDSKLSEGTVRYDILEMDGNMNINFYVKPIKAGDEILFSEAYSNWLDMSNKLKDSMTKLYEVLK